MTHPDPETSIERLIKLAGERDLPSPKAWNVRGRRRTNPGTACSGNVPPRRAVPG